MDANLAIQRVKNGLIKAYNGQITPAADKNENLYLTKALVAAHVSDTFGVPLIASVDAITDGSNDGGIDGIYIDHQSKTINLYQSKFSQSPDAVLDQGDILKFINGIKAIIRADFSSFNNVIKAKQPMIESALQQVDYTIRIYIITTSESELSTHVSGDIDNLLRQQNEYDSNFLKFEFIRLSEVSKLAVRIARPSDINFNAMIKSYGRIHQPYQVVHGLVSANDIFNLYKENGTSLFDENVRFFLGASNVNEGIVETASQDPNHFPYFNNGITALCSRIKKAPIGGEDQNAGVFEFEGFSIVNGAQTVGSISAAIDRGFSPEFFMFIRVISLEEAEDGFGNKISRFTNTQNELLPVDFVALDPNQERLRREFGKQNIDYKFRRGSLPIPSAQGSIDISEATVALACCSDDLKLAVSAKRNLSQLWESISKRPYTKIFNDRTNAARIHNVVMGVRKVQDILSQLTQNLDGKKELIAIHGNRFLAHTLFTHNNTWFDNFLALTNEDLQEFENSIRAFLEKTIEYCEDHFSDAYAGNIFKNTDKQDEIKNYIMTGAANGTQENLPF